MAKEKENVKKEISSFEDLQSDIGNRRVIVFGGFSGLGYEDTEKLNDYIGLKIKEEFDKVGSKLVVVSGATSDGIGLCYEVAKRFGLETYGIVSEAGKEYGSDKHCDKTFYVPDPNNTWQVMSPEGSSYMVDVAKKNGVLIYYGGGDVAVSEITEAKSKNIDVEINTSFNPNPAQVAKKQAKNPDLDPTPLKSFVEKEWLNQQREEGRIPKDFKYENGVLQKNVASPLFKKIRGIMDSYRSSAMNKNNSSPQI